MRIPPKDFIHTCYQTQVISTTVYKAQNTHAADLYSEANKETEKMNPNQEFNQALTTLAQAMEKSFAIDQTSIEYLQIPLQKGEITNLNS